MTLIAIFDFILPDQPAIQKPTPWLFDGLDSLLNRYYSFH